MASKKNARCYFDSLRLSQTSESQFWARHRNVEGILPGDIKCLLARESKQLTDLSFLVLPTLVSLFLKLKNPNALKSELNP
jgi:hypothetical protein